LASRPLRKDVKAAEKEAGRKGWRSLRDVRKELGVDA
jgi:hypothetical protein